MDSSQAKQGAERQPLALTTDGKLEITFVGSGSAFSKRFYQNNILIVKGQDHLLVDCGTRTPEALTKLGLSVIAVRNYLITHLHADHIGGLEEVMLVNRYAVKRKTSMVATPELRDMLWSMSLRGGTSFNEIHDGKPLEFADFWDLIEPTPIPGGDRELCEARVGGIEVELFRTMHIPDNAPDWRSSFRSYGLVIDRRILFSSDTRFDPAMIEELDARYRLETIFHDCQLFKGGVHASLDELAGLPEKTRAKTMLMHYGDAIDDHRARIAELGFKGVVEQWKTYGFQQPKAKAAAKARAKRA
jgi:ribonuclease BN (tRNA processing enzyme)